MLTDLLSAVCLPQPRLHRLRRPIDALRIPLAKDSDSYDADKDGPLKTGWTLNVKLDQMTRVRKRLNADDAVVQSMDWRNHVPAHTAADAISAEQ